MLPVPLDLQPRAHPCRLGAELELQLDPRHEPVGRAVILAANGGRRGGGILDVEHGADLGAAREGRNCRISPGGHRH
jgi:hypothetical protein